MSLIYTRLGKELKLRWTRQHRDPKSLTDRTVVAAQAILSGERRGPAAYLAFAGPAIVASIAYMDPGNFATNIQAGAKYGYSLLWVVLLANLIAMLFQALSAKLGIVTGRNLAEMCRDHFPRPVVWAMWVVSEIAAMATDLAEFLGGAIGLSLLFKMPLICRHGGHRGHHLRHPDVREPRLPPGRADHRQPGRHHRALLPDRDVHRAGRLGRGGLSFGRAGNSPTPRRCCISVGIIGATVMPHAVYLHSGLTQARTPGRDEQRAAPAGAHLQP